MSDTKYAPLGKLSALQKLQVRLGNTGVRISPLGLLVGFFSMIALCYYILIPAPVPLTSTATQVSMKELIKASIEFAERGGKILVDIRNSPDIGQASKGTHDDVAADDIGADDPVTNGDKESHKAMTFGFTKYFPTVHVVSEEHTASPDLDAVPAPSNRNREVDRILTSDEYLNPDRITVWIDPLDATQEYTEDLRQYVTTMVCIVYDDKPIAGIIHKPFEKSTSWAWVGHGGNLVDNSSAAPKNSVIVSRSHAGGVKEAAKTSLGEDVTVVPAGGAGYKAVSLFDGVAEAYIHTTLIKKWDLCPGHAILKAYKGNMSHLDGTEINYKYDSDTKSEGGMVSSLNHYPEMQKAFKDAYNV